MHGQGCKVPISVPKLCQLGLLLALLGCSSPTPTPAPATTPRSGTPLVLTGSGGLVLTAYSASGYCISSLKWGGLEFLDATDFGRELQSSYSEINSNPVIAPTECGAVPQSTPTTVV